MATRRTSTKRPAAPAPEVDEIEDLEVDELDVEELDDDVEEETPKPAPKRRAAAAKKPATRAKKAAPPVDEEDDDEEEEPAPAPKRRGRPAAKAPAEKPAPAAQRPDVEFGTQWLVDHVNEKCGANYKAYDLRVLLRKMAKNNELDREVGADRSRYSFTGPNDPVVKAVVKKVGDGAVEAEKKASLDKLKEKTAAKSAGGNVTQLKKRGRPAKPKPPVDDEEDLDDDDVEELD